MLAANKFCHKYCSIIQILTCQSFLTNTSVCVNTVYASGTLHAWHRFTFVDIQWTSFPFVSRWTTTLVVIDKVYTRCIILTRHRQAFVEIKLATFSGVTRFTITLKTTFRIYAYTVVTNFIIRHLTFVNVNVAQSTWNQAKSGLYSLTSNKEIVFKLNISNQLNKTQNI